MRAITELDIGQIFLTRADPHKTEKLILTRPDSQPDPRVDPIRVQLWDTAY